MAKVEALIALETTQSAVMLAHYVKQGRAVRDAILTHLNAGDYDAAYREAEKPFMAGVVERSRARLEELSVSAMLLGASQLVPAKDSALVRGDQRLEHHTANALFQLTVMVEEDGERAIRKDLIDIINDTVSQDGRTLFTKAETKSLAQMLNEAAMGSGKAVINIGANLTTSRLISYGFLSQAGSMAIETYQVSEILDSRTCPVCRFMHGKEFNVQTELGRLEQILQVMDPQELKAIAPWPKQNKSALSQLFAMDAGQLQSAGYGSPPYHPNCRGILQKMGTVEFTMPTIPLPKLPTATALTPVEYKPVDVTNKPTTPAFLDISDVQNLIDAIQSQRLRERAQKAWSAYDLVSLMAILTEAGVL